MLLESKKVKIEGLGTFYCTVENTKGGAAKKEDFNVNKHLKALHIRFLPEQEAEQNISSREFLKKAEFINIEQWLKARRSSPPRAGSHSGGGGERWQRRTETLTLSTALETEGAEQPSAPSKY